MLYNIAKEFTSGIERSPNFNLFVDADEPITILTKLFEYYEAIGKKVPCTEDEFASNLNNIFHFRCKYNKTVFNDVVRIIGSPDRCTISVGSIVVQRSIKSNMYWETNDIKEVQFDSRINHNIAFMYNKQSGEKIYLKLDVLKTNILFQFLTIKLPINKERKIGYHLHYWWIMYISTKKLDGQLIDFSMIQIDREIQLGIYKHDIIGPYEANIYCIVYKNLKSITTLNISPSVV